MILLHGFLFSFSLSDYFGGASQLKNGLVTVTMTNWEKSCEVANWQQGLRGKGILLIVQGTYV